MMSALYAGVSGLTTQQSAMDVVGNNLANVNTVGFKASTVTFQEILSQTSQGGSAASTSEGGQNPIQIGLGTSLAAVSRNMEQGALQSTGNTLDLAIEGEGFFIVGNQENYFYTRSGSMNVDNAFNLVTGGGDLVYGWVDTDQNGVIDPALDQLDYINLDRRGDGEITNVLASTTPPLPGANTGDASLPAVSTLTSTISDQWTATCVDAATGTFEIIGERTGLLGMAVAGQTFTDDGLGSFLISAGAPAQAGLSIDPDGDGTTINLVALDYGAGGNDISIALIDNGVNQSLGVSVDGNQITVNLATDALGQVTSTEAEVVVALQSHAQASTLVSVTGGSVGVAAETTTTYLSGGSGAAEGDTFTFTTTAPGGAALESIAVGADGTIIGIFENGTTEELARVAVASVPNPEGLLAVGGGMYAESPSSGSGFPPHVAGTDGVGSITAGYLEMSNVDLTQEFTNMIVLQRGFQASSRVITTCDEMLQELLALKR